MYAAPRPQRQSACDCETPAWLSAAEELGCATSAPRFGCADSAAKAFWFAASVASAAAFWLMPAKADGFADIAAKACELARTACDTPAFQPPAPAAEATSEWASSDCSEWPAELS